MIGAGQMWTKTAGRRTAKPTVNFSAPRSAPWLCALLVTCACATTETPSTKEADQARIVFVLARQRADLGELALAVSTPGSPSYGEYWSVEAIASAYGASADSIARTDQTLRGVGAAPELDVTGTFMSAILTETQATTLFGNGLVAAVPPELDGAVTVVLGLSTFRAPPQPNGPPFPAPTAKNVTATVPWPAWTRASGTHPPCPSKDSAHCTSGFSNPAPQLEQTAFSPLQLRTAYGFDATHLTGTGRSAVVLQWGGLVAPSDMRAYEEGIGIPRVNLHQVRLDNAPGQPGGNGEATLDVQTIAGLAPGLERITLINGWGAPQGKWDAYNPIVYSSALDVNHTGGVLTDVISSSWGQCELGWSEQALETVEVILQTAAAAGVTVVVAAGDQGSAGCVSRTPPFTDTEQAVVYPGSSRWTTSAGGTSLQLNANNTIREAPVWNSWPLRLNEELPGLCHTPPCRPWPVWAGGGGMSAVFEKPSWQDGVNAGPARVVPDVAFSASAYPGVLIHRQGAWAGRGDGTSQAAPTFAAVTLVANEAAADAGLPRLGFANPLIYHLGEHSPDIYWDVVEGDNRIGNNDERFDNPCCVAKEGWDAASGWGIPLVDRLIQARSAL